MSVLQNIFKISYVGKNQISEHGDFGIFENIFRVEKATGNDNRVVHISYQALLPSGSDDEYMSVIEAAGWTGLSVKKLKELCNKGKLEYITDGKKWYIKKDSLEKYT